MESVYSTISSLGSNNSPVQRLNRTLFLQACRFSMVAGTVFWLIVVLMGLPSILWACTLVPTITSAVIHYKYNQNIERASQVFYIVHLMALALGYFFNGGSYGTVLFIVFVLIIVILFLAPSKHVFFTTTTIVVMVGVISGEIFMDGQLDRPHFSETHRLVDIAIAWSVSLFMCAWIIVFARKAYETERARSELADQAKSRFLATMSHEIRTPLNAIVGLNSLALEKTKHDPLVHNYLEEVGKSSEHLLLIINDILDFSKIEAGQMELDIGSFSIEDLISHLKQTYQIIASQKGIDFEVEVAKELSSESLMGDSQRIRQILYNLLSNACKFTTKGGVKLEVKSESIKSGIRGLDFVISDTGVGIPQGRISALFDDYQQGGNDISSKFGGTGLGLAISKRLVKMMKGNLSVESVEGKGSKFEFRVELAVDDKFKAIARVTEKDKELLPGLKILVAEDNLVNQKLIKILLEKVKADFTIVANGEEALLELNTRVYDVVLMDIEMPILDGFSATEALRKGRAGVLNQFIPVVALTAHAIVEMRQKGKEVGMNYYLTKPLRPKDMNKVLAEIQHGLGDFAA